MLAHVPDINDFVAGVKIALKPNGVNTFEFPHLCKLIEENHPINLNNYVTEYEVNQVKMAKKQLNQTNQLKPIFDHLSGEIDYRKISVALTILSKYH